MQMRKNTSTEKYIHDYDSAVTKSMAHRQAAEYASFLLPYLHAGMSLLDCGCGPGSITADLAAVVSPGRVVGLDIEDSQREVARALVRERGLSNVTFMTGTVYDLPFEDSEFDVVFSNSLLEHLHEPVKALREMGRVIRRGGVVAVRDVDLSGGLWWPRPGNLGTLLSLYVRYREVSGGDPFIGKKLRGYLDQAGFSETQFWATYHTAGSDEAVDQFGAFALELLTETGFREQAVDLGWITSNEFEVALAELHQWRQHPGAISARAWCAALGWKR